MTNKEAKMAKSNLSIKIESCASCERNYKRELGTQIADELTWDIFYSNLMAFSNDTMSIVINEDRLMTYIQMLNPAQEKRTIRLVSGKEFIKLISHEEE